MRIISVIILVVAVGALTAAAVYVLTMPRDHFPQGTQSLPYRFSVGESPGVDTGTDIFRLGRVTPGGASWRTLTIASGVSSATTEEQVSRRVVVLARGDGSEWIVVKPTVVTLPADVNITLSVAATAPYGEYQGTLYVVPYDG